MSSKSYIELILHSLTRDKSFEEALERIWNEYPGGLSNLTEEELLIKEDGDLAEPVKDVEEVESAPEEQGTMKPEEMEAVRSDIFVKLKYVIYGPASAELTALATRGTSCGLSWSWPNH